MEFITAGRIVLLFLYMNKAVIISFITTMRRIVAMVFSYGRGNQQWIVAKEDAITIL